MLIMLTLYLLVVSLSVAMVLLGVASAVRGSKRWGWHGRRSPRNWISIGAVLLGVFMFTTRVGELPLGNLVFGVLLGVALTLLLNPLIVREDERIDRSH